MLARDYLNSEDSIILSPRRNQLGKDYEIWSLSHLDIKGDIYNDVVLIKNHDLTIFTIYVFTDDDNFKDNHVQLSKIINLIHDISDEFELKIEIVQDIFSNEIDDSINKLIEN